jgi:hypothetical protein
MPGYLNNPEATAATIDEVGIGKNLAAAVAGSVLIALRTEIRRSEVSFASLHRINATDLFQQIFCMLFNLHVTQRP